MSRVKIGKLFSQVGGTNTVIQIFAPADNKQGAILRTIALDAGASSSVAQAALYADTSAPTVPGDATKRCISLARASANAYITTIVPYEIEIPAGLGLWLGCFQTAGIQITYDFIDV